LGLVRTNNEDRGFYSCPTDAEVAAMKGNLVIVADGMGGERAGEVASRKAVSEITNLIWEQMSADTAIDCNELVTQAINKANKEIYLLARDNPAQSSMGTTVSFAFFSRNLSL
jgi:serine/threonine protein phosphatase PrpC